MLKFSLKYFCEINPKIMNKAHKFIEVKIDNKEKANFRLDNFIRHSYELTWSNIQKLIRKKDIYILRDDKVIRKSQEKLEINDKVFISKYALNIFDKNESNSTQQIRAHDSHLINSYYSAEDSTKIITSQDKPLSINKEIESHLNSNQSHLNSPNTTNKSFSKANKNMRNSQNKEDSNKLDILNVDKNGLSDENIFLLDLFQGMVRYSSNLFLIIDKKYNIASQRGSFLKFSIDDCLKLLNQSNQGYNLKLVHRLDRNVSGLMIIGNDIDFVRKIGEEMKDSNISKTYVCLCQNIPKFFKELIKENRLSHLRPEHFIESLKGNIFSDESANSFSIVTQSGYLYRKIEINNIGINDENDPERLFQSLNTGNNSNIENSNQGETKEFILKKLNNYSYNKILSEKAFFNQDSTSFKTNTNDESIKINDKSNENEKYKYEMQGRFKVTHFIFKDTNEFGCNFIAFDLDKLEFYDEETLEKFNNFLNKFRSKKEHQSESKDEKNDSKNIDLFMNNDSTKQLKDLIKAQKKLNKLQKLSDKEKKSEGLQNNVNDEFYTLVTYELISGKKHQIRKHMSKCFLTPIFNDEDYFFNNNISSTAYKHFTDEIGKPRNLKSNENSKKFKNGNENKDDIHQFYKRFSVDDFSKGIFLNSFQIKMNNIIGGELHGTKIQFIDNDSFKVTKTKSEIIFQKRYLSENFKKLLYSLGISHAYQYYSDMNDNNLI